MSLHDSHSMTVMMTPVDGTDQIKIIQSKISSAGHLIIMNRCQNVILEGFYNFSHFCLQFFSFLNVVFSCSFSRSFITF